MEDTSDVEFNIFLIRFFISLGPPNLSPDQVNDEGQYLMTRMPYSLRDLFKKIPKINGVYVKFATIFLLFWLFSFLLLFLSSRWVSLEITLEELIEIQL